MIAIQSIGPFWILSCIDLHLAECLVRSLQNRQFYGTVLSVSCFYMKNKFQYAVQELGETP